MVHQPKFRPPETFRWKLVEGLVVFSGLGLVAVLALWPLGRLLPWASTYFGDPLINSWILSWTSEWRGSFSALWNSPIFHPSPLSLTFSENLLGISLFAWPLARFLDALTVHNILLIVSFPLTGLATYYLARSLPASRGAALISAVLFMMHPWRFTQLPHLQFLWALWLPLLLLAIIAFCRKPSRLNAILLAACLILNGLSNLHYLAFSVAMIPLAVFLLGPGDRRFWLRGGIALGTGMAILAGVLWPYRQSTELYGLRSDLDEVARYSAHASDWLVGSLGPAFYRSWIVDVTVDPERWLFPGVMLTLLSLLFLLSWHRTSWSDTETGARWPVRLTMATAILLALVGTYRVVHRPPGNNGPNYLLAACVVAVLAVSVYARSRLGTFNVRSLLDRSRWKPEEILCLVLILLGFLGSLGVHSFLHPALSDLTSLFAGIRAPARWATVAYLGMVLIAGRATDRWFESPRLRLPVQALVVALALLELWPAPIRYQLLAERRPEVYEWLSTCDSPVIAELPILQEREYLYLLGETLHQSPTINGTSGFEPPTHEKLRRLANSDPIPDEFVAALQDVDVSLLILHTDQVRNVEATRPWLDREVSAGRLTPIGRAAAGWKGDWVFAVAGGTRPRCTDPLMAATFPGAAGVFELSAPPPQHWTFGHVDSPTFGSTVEEALTVTGWAVSPRDVAEVVVLIDHRRLAFPAKLQEGPDLQEVFGDIVGEQPRFSATIERPAGVPEQTDLQVMVIDGDGTVTYLPQIWIDWIGGD